VASLDCIFTFLVEPGFGWFDTLVFTFWDCLIGYVDDSFGELCCWVGSCEYAGAVYVEVAELGEPIPVSSLESPAGLLVWCNDLQ